MELSTIGIVSGVLALVVAVLGLVIWCVTRNKDATLYRASFALAALVFVFIPLSTLDEHIGSLLDTLEDFANYPRTVEAAYRAYTPDCGQLQSDCAFCKAERTAAADVARDYQISGVDDLRDGVDQYRVWLYWFGGIVVAIGGAIVLFALLFSGSRAKWKWVSKYTSSTGGFFLGGIGLLLLTVGLLLYHLCDTYVNVDSLGSEARWFVDPAADNDASGRPWLEDLASFNTRCTDATDDVKRVNNPGALAGEYNSLEDALCTGMSASLVAAGAVIIGALVAWEVALLVFFYRPSLGPGSQNEGRSDRINMLLF